jgi:hypothetical protein
MVLPDYSNKGNLLTQLHFLGKEMDSRTVTITMPVNSLEAFMILVVLQGERVYWR